MVPNLILAYADTGGTRLFVHCGETWKTSDKCPPAAFCPLCESPIIDVYATINDLHDWVAILDEELKRREQSEI